MDCHDTRMQLIESLIIDNWTHFELCLCVYVNRTYSKHGQQRVHIVFPVCTLARLSIYRWCLGLFGLFYPGRLTPIDDGQYMLIDDSCMF